MLRNASSIITVHKYVFFLIVKMPGFSFHVVFVLCKQSTSIHDTHQSNDL